MSTQNQINYVEFPAHNLLATKAFFEKAFEWTFQDYGPEYTAFSNQGIDGGFFQSEQKSSSEHGSALIVLFSHNLEESLGKVEEANGVIVKSIFSFPGGRRFHFTEPSGNELAVWSDK